MSEATCQKDRLPQPIVVCLRQSARHWAGLLVDTTVEYGMEQCRTHPCVCHTVVNGKVEPIMAVHVDDEIDKVFKFGRNIQRLPRRVSYYFSHEQLRRTDLVYWLRFQT